MWVSLFSTCHAMRSLRRASLSLSSGCCWLYSSVKNAWYEGNIKRSFHDVLTHMCTFKEHQSYPVRDIITLSGFWGWTLIIFQGMNTSDFNNFIAFNVIWTELMQSLRKGILILNEFKSIHRGRWKFAEKQSPQHRSNFRGLVIIEKEHYWDGEFYTQSGHG